MSMLMKNLVVVVAVMCSMYGNVVAQSVDWVVRLPRMPIGWQVGTSRVVEDVVRQRLFTLGWKRGTTLLSEDEGRSWSGEYSIYTDVVGKNANLIVLADGTYLYHGQTPFNQRVAVVSSDGGETWRKLTEDPRVLKEGIHNGIVEFIEPHYITALDSSANSGGTSKLLSADLGRTWRPFPVQPLDTGVVSNAWHQAAPYIIYWSGRTHWYRCDVRTDTVWSTTSVPSELDGAVELGASVVGSMNGRLAYMVHVDSAVTVTDLSILSALAITDSTAYVFDSAGCTYEIQPRTGSIRRLSCVSGSSTGEQLALDLASKYGSLVLAVWRDAADTWIMEEFDLEAGTSTINRARYRRSPVLYNNTSPLTYLGEKGLFMITDQPPKFREVVRTLDLGSTWILSDTIDVKDLVPAFLPMSSAVQTESGELLLQSGFDHLLRKEDDQWKERMQYLTTGHERVLERKPTLFMDEDDVLVPGAMLLKLDPTTCAFVDTILPRRAMFMRRLSDDMLAAGNDSLWLSFTNKREWIYVPAGLTDVPPTQRGKVSDVARLLNGDLLCAIRGVDSVDPAGLRGILKRGGITKSTDDGDTWSTIDSLPEGMTHVTTLLTLPSGNVLAHCARVVNDPTSPLVESAALLRSVDNGAQWTIVARDFRSNIPYPDMEPNIVQVANGAIVATMYSGNVVVSFDDGENWDVVDAPELGTTQVNNILLRRDGSLLISTDVGVGILRIPSVTAVDEHRSTSTIHQIAMDGVLHYQWKGAPATLTIRDLNGCTYAVHTAQTGDNRFDIANLVPGVYSITCVGEQSFERSLFVKP